MSTQFHALEKASGRVRAAAPVAVAVLTALALIAPAGQALSHDGLGGIDALPQASTRGLAMGETGLTQTGESESFMTNPSCLTSIVGNQVRVTYGNWFQGLSSSRTILLYATSLGSDMQYPGEPDLGRRYGLGLAFDRTGVELSRGSAWACNVVYVGLAWAPVPYIAAGLAPKLILSSSGLESGKVRGFSVDWGVRVDLSRSVALSFIVRNIPGGADWQNGESENLPAVYAFGTSVLLPYDLLAEFMFAASGSVDDKVGLGLEAPFLDSALEVRVGAIWLNGIENRSAVTAGFGVNLSVVDFDYAVRLDEDWATGTTHRFSLRFDF